MPTPARPVSPPKPGVVVVVVAVLAGVVAAVPVLAWAAGVDVVDMVVDPAEGRGVLYGSLSLAGSATLAFAVGALVLGAATLSAAPLRSRVDGRSARWLAETAVVVTAFFLDDLYELHEEIGEHLGSDRYEAVGYAVLGVLVVVWLLRWHGRLGDVWGWLLGLAAALGAASLVIDMGPHNDLVTVVEDATKLAAFVTLAAWSLLRARAEVLAGLVGAGAAPRTPEASVAAS